MGSRLIASERLAADEAYTMARCRLLELCQELRDMIYEYAFAEDHSLEEGEARQTLFTEKTDTTPPTLSADDRGPDPHGWHICYPSASAQPTWLALSKCNHQLRAEILDFLARQHHKPNPSPPEARGSIHLAYPSCTSTITSLPAPPANCHSLHLTLHLSNLYHAAMLPPSAALAAAVWSTVQRYTTHGPRLHRTTPLARPLHLDTLKVELAGPADRDLVFAYDNPWMQMASHYSCLKWRLGQLARAETAGELSGRDGRVEIRMIRMRLVGREWERVYEARGKEEAGARGEGAGDGDVPVEASETLPMSSRAVWM